MRPSAALREALERYRAIEREIVSIGTSSDPDRKLALVRARRTLSEQIGIIGMMIEDDADLARHAELQKEFGRLFAAVRYSLALHQANWPVVKIDEDHAAYLASARGAQEKSDIFWTWCRANLDLDAASNAA